MWLKGHDQAKVNGNQSNFQKVRGLISLCWSVSDSNVSHSWSNNKYHHQRAVRHRKPDLSETSIRAVRTKGVQFASSVSGLFFKIKSQCYQLDLCTFLHEFQTKRWVNHSEEGPVTDEGIQSSFTKLLPLVSLINALVYSCFSGQ